MNNTGRLPGFAMIHVGMEMRLTQSVEPPDGVKDAPCEVVGMDLHPEEPRSHREQLFPSPGRAGAAEPGALSVVVLHRQPLCVYVKLEDTGTEFLPPAPCDDHSVCGADRTCANCKFYPGILAVKPLTNSKAWAIDIDLATEGGVRSLRICRTQLPLVCVKACTLHVLQGTTADPGLIFHWAFPRRLSRSLRWLAIYVALSRVRRLKNLRSIGLNQDIRSLMEAGPPDTLPEQFARLFRDKELQTTLDANAAMTALGWSG